MKRFSIVFFALVLVACAPAAAVLDLLDAECTQLEQQPQPAIVTVVCDVVNTAGVVVQTFELSATPDEAADIIAKHPVKAGHPNPASLVH